MEYHDVVIAGGAVMGSSIACHLLMHEGFSGRVLVLEPDPGYARSASALSAGSIRQQFSQPVNIRISQHGFPFLKALGEALAVGDERPSVGLVERGYLYCASGAGAATLRANHAVQSAEGAQVALMDAVAARARFPFLAGDDLAAASYGLSGEGWFDGYGLLQAFRQKARALGASYRAARVTGVVRDGGRVSHAVLEGGERVACGSFVVAAGASGARALAAACGADLPVFAKKRCVFSFSCRTALPDFPMLIDTSGVWCRPEGEGYIAGYSPQDGDETDHAADFEVAWSLWEEVIWPALAHRVPAFEAVRPGRAWAGHYDMNLFDANALVGPLAPGSNAFIAAGFSGHGLQQAPAVGRGLAELILRGRYESLDLSDLDPGRIAAGRPLVERNVI